MPATPHPASTAPPITTLACARPRLLLILLSLAISSAPACGDRTAPGPVTGALPAATPIDHQDVHGGASGDSATHADAHAPAAPALPGLPVTPWPGDRALREGMRRMQRAVEALGHAEHHHLDAGQTIAAAQQVQAAAEYMIANCKLAPEPDAALHGLLATLLTGAAAIKADPATTAPVAEMREAMALYPRLFQDADWQADTSGVD